MLRQSLTALTLSAALVAPAMADVQVGDTPEYSFTDLEGNTFTNESFHGNVLVMDFWATWCGPCVAAMPHMLDTYEEYSPQGLQIVGISMDDGNSRNTVEQFVADRGIPWTNGFSGAGWQDPMGQQFGVNGIPAIYIFSPTGEVLWTGHPMQMDDALEDIMEQFGGEGGEAPSYTYETLLDASGEFGGEGSMMSYDGKYIQQFEVELQEGDRVEIALNSDAADTFLAVHTPDNSVLTDDDGGDGTNSRLVVRNAQAGTYTIYATTYNPGSEGAFDIAIEQRIAESAE